MDAEDSKEEGKKAISRPSMVAYLFSLCVLGVLCVPLLTKVSRTMDPPEAGRQLCGKNYSGGAARSRAAEVSGETGVKYTSLTVYDFTLLVTMGTISMCQ